MGLKDRLNQNLQLSQCMTIEFTNGLNPDSQLCIPDTRLTGFVIVRNPKVLSVGEIRITIYGISDAYIHRSIHGIRADFYGRGFLFQQIRTLTGTPVNLQPNLEPGHRFPFDFTLPQHTMPMTENTANKINKWQTKECFAGAPDMHTLPPTCKFYKKALLGFTESSVSYRVDATCTKIKGGSSWLPQTSRTLLFSPARTNQNPESRLQPVNSQHQMRSGQALNVLLYIPTISYAGGPFPVMIACQGVPFQSIVSLTSLTIKLEGITLTRGRSLLFGEKESSEKQDIILAEANSLSLPISSVTTNLMERGFRLGVPQNIIPSFKSFTVTQMPYIVHISYTFRAGDEMIKGRAPNSQVDVLPAVFKA
ncbi:MAG: hypothetical protein L6R40_007260 [Gallowayella cf. fulva]|nr:MAG: hypothetical protein L6R40_007260 [Xanthomendoza cf. fulva]